MDLAAALAAPLIGRVVGLPPALLAAFPELGAVRCRRGGLPPRVAGWLLGQRTVAAVTLWNTVFLSSGTDAEVEAELLLHELRHVHHFQTGPTFPLRYLWESLRRGYRDNRYEVDARAYARARLRAGAARGPDPCHGER